MEQIKKELFTRKDRMDGLCTHREFFAQFVTDEVREMVKSSIGEVRIKVSTDEHFNDIPMKMWDNLHDYMGRLVKPLWIKIVYPDAKAMSWSQSDNVCIAKEAARQIKERSE